MLKRFVIFVSEPGVYDKSDECGTPLLQMLLYAHIEQMKEKLERPKIDYYIVKRFIDEGAQLDCVISPAQIYCSYSRNCLSTF